MGSGTRPAGGRGEGCGGQGWVTYKLASWRLHVQHVRPVSHGVGPWQRGTVEQRRYNTGRQAAPCQGQAGRQARAGAHPRNRG